MKRKIAGRKLKKRCEWCGRGFEKGDVFYHERKVWHFYDGENENILAVNKTKCPKCHYQDHESLERYMRFQQTCQHEKRELIHEVWDYIPGEAVMEPQFDVCHLCGNIL